MKPIVLQIPDGHKKMLLTYLFPLLTREQLREIAREHNIPVGRNKSDTIVNIITSGKNSLTKIGLNITIEP